MGIFSQGFYLGRGGMTAKKLSPKKLVGRLAAVLLGFFIILLAAGYFFRERLVFYPAKGLNLTVANAGWDFEEVWLPGTGGARINGWYLPGPPDRYTVLLLHGNSGNLENMIGRVMTYHRLKLGVLAIDYQGFGLSEGESTLESAVLNSRAALDFLLRKNIPPEMIAVHGFSLGGGVAGQLVAQTPEVRRPLIMDSTFTSLAAAGRDQRAFLGPLAGLILGQAYDSEKVLRIYRPEVLISLHSPQDEVVPYFLGRELFDSYQGGPKFWTDLRGGHNDYIINQDLYENALIQGLGLTFN
ncbi:MAG: alpha/beta hydrolase [Deltaproteobacteria bacterium]|jgi:pimeloyl-ACP methyl ester carboxylesterase|nr:alpha/beta hydrolase [Deltaproteobacteria bacterium]